MSLKAFHVLFISLSVVLTVFFGMWALSAYSTQGGPGYLTSACLSFLCGGALVAYEVAFVRKCRRLE